jgi:hypothetical protein
LYWLRSLIAQINPAVVYGADFCKPRGQRFCV